MQIEVKVIKEGRLKEVEFECPACGYTTLKVSRYQEGEIECGGCHAKLSWEVKDVKQQGRIRERDTEDMARNK